ncbi:hypothetical protein Tco_0609766, partial [Tanacetum coccineum]
KKSRHETHSSHASGSGADEGTGVKPGVPDALDYDSEDDISWKSSGMMTMQRNMTFMKLPRKKKMMMHMTMIRKLKMMMMKN